MMGLRLMLLVPLLCLITCLSAKQPNIIVLLADDMGWNDIGIHGSEIPTPNIDALAYSGIVFRRHYAQPCCTPSRSAFLTGQYPIRYGLQGTPIASRFKEALPTNITILPQMLKTLGYRTHLVGKWHQGYSTWSHVPTRRGFDSFFGYLNGFLSYYDGVHYDNTNMGPHPEVPNMGLDFRVNEEESWPTAYAKYLPQLLNEQAQAVVRDHNKNHKNSPLFLMVATNAPHAGGNRRFADEVTPERSNATDFITDIERRTLAGGVRVPAILWKSGLNQTMRTYDNLFHMTDWLPTLNAAAGGEHIVGLDGVDQWSAINANLTVTPRTEFLVEIDDLEKSWAYVKENYKFVKSYNLTSGSTILDEYYSPPPQVIPGGYDFQSVLDSSVTKALGIILDGNTCLGLRDTLMVPQSCSKENQTTAVLHDCSYTGCLFDIIADPAECFDISSQHPDVMAELMDKLSSYRAVMVPKRNLPADNVRNSRNYFTPSSGELAKQRVAASVLVLMPILWLANSVSR